MLPRAATTATILAGISGLWILPGQTPKAPFDAFEVATIKPSDPSAANGARYIRMQSAHRFQVKNYTAEGLIAAAYDLNPRAISGVPGWVASERYEIIAETPGDARPTYDDQMTMLRKLLEDRFRLVVHRETKEFSIYEITIAKGGAKLSATAAPPDAPTNLTSTVYPAAGGGVDYLKLPARNVTIRQFASILQRAILDRPVVDRTGLTGRYDFDLEWRPDESEFGGALPPAADSGKPDFFAGVRQQLGLKIEAKRGPVEGLTIDRIERPSAN